MEEVVCVFNVAKEKGPYDLEVYHLDENGEVNLSLVEVKSSACARNSTFPISPYEVAKLVDVEMANAWAILKGKPRIDYSIVLIEDVFGPNPCITEIANPIRQLRFGTIELHMTVMAQAAA